MGRRIVVIGGVAAGMSAASQAKRRMREAEVIVLERGKDVSYGACGMPYNIEESDRDIRDLVVVTAEQFREERGIDLRTGHEVAGLDVSRKVLRVREVSGGRVYEQPYDSLVIATGASPVRPPLDGLDLPGVFFLRALSDGSAIKRFLREARPRRAVIVGAGYIGLEMAEVLRALELEVTVLEKMEQAIPGFDRAIADVATDALQRHGVRVETGVTVQGIEGRGELTVRTDQGRFDADLVLVSVGVRPNVALARAAGIELGPTGAIAVDAGMQTSAADVYAAGDCAEAYHRILDAPAYIPLGTTANKQGRIAGANAAGAEERFGGIVGSAGFKLFELEVARTGLGATEIEGAGIEAVRAQSSHPSRAHGYPGGGKITTVLFAERGSGRLLGAQMIGPDAVAKRIDVFATALQAGLTVAEVEELDLSYAPPFSPVWDPILIAARMATKSLRKGDARRAATQLRKEGDTHRPATS